VTAILRALYPSAATQLVKLGWFGAELRVHRAIAPALTGAPAVWRRVWPHLAGLVRDSRVARLAGELSESGAARERELRAWAQRDKIRRASLFLLENSQKTLDEQLRTTQAQAEERRRSDARQIEGLSRHAAELEGLRDRNSDKIRRMQASFSWRATAPLRALRRAFDRRGAVPAQAPDSPAPPSWERFHHHLDAPRAWRRQGGSIVIRGWCFSEEPAPLQGIRARVGGRIHEGA